MRGYTVLSNMWRLALDMRPFKCCVTLFSGNWTPTPRNGNNVEPYTFVTLSTGNFTPSHLRYLTLE